MFYVGILLHQDGKSSPPAAFPNLEYMQMRWRPGLRLGPQYMGKLTALPETLAGFGEGWGQGVLEIKGRGKREGRGGRGKGWEELKLARSSSGQVWEEVDARGPDWLAGVTTHAVEVTVALLVEHSIQTNQFQNWHSK